MLLKPKVLLGWSAHHHNPHNNHHYNPHNNQHHNHYNNHHYNNHHHNPHTWYVQVKYFNSAVSNNLNVLTPICKVGFHYSIEINLILNILLHPICKVPFHYHKDGNEDDEKNR